MHIHGLYLCNFRLYQEAKFSFKDTFNAISGPNATGKTTLLEALYLLVRGRSFRTPHLKDLIRHESPGFFLEAFFVKHGVEHKIRFSFGGGERKIVFNHTPYSSINDLLGVLPGVVFTPDDKNLICGAPDWRRQYMNGQLSQVDPLYVHHMARYYQAMRQRNILLKAKSVSTIESWETEMALSAAYLVKQRIRLTEELNALCSEWHPRLSGTVETLSLAYPVPHPEPTPEIFLSLYEKFRERELRCGYTLHGPHRDDLIVKMQGQDVRHFASEGQQRSAAASLRFAEWQRLAALVEEPPLMLIDDIGTSFDQNRSDTFLRHIKQLGQVFVTQISHQEAPVHAV